MSAQYSMHPQGAPPNVANANFAQQIPDEPTLGSATKELIPISEEYGRRLWK